MLKMKHQQQIEALEQRVQTLEVSINQMKIQLDELIKLLKTQ
jgi:hypothetical protein